MIKFRYIFNASFEMLLDYSPPAPLHYAVSSSIRKWQGLESGLKTGVLSASLEDLSVLCIPKINKSAGATQCSFRDSYVNWTKSDPIKISPTALADRLAGLISVTLVQLFHQFI